jgi:hypothetical protein
MKLKMPLMKFYIALTSLAFFIGCEDEINPAKTVKAIPTSNIDYKVVLLFEVDGCKVYRFKDYYSRYFTNCSPGIIGGHYQSSGKTSHYVDDSNPTFMTIKRSGE